MALGLLGGIGGDASAKRAKHKDKPSASSKSCTGKGKHRKCRRRQSAFSGHGVAKSALRTDPLERPSGDVWIYAENLAEEVKTNIYKPDGTFDDAALAQLDNLFRCKRTNEVRAVDPHVYETLSRIQDHFTGKRAVLISGFRFAERDSSRHFHASAMDIRIPDIGLNDLYAYAQSLDAGGMGMGIYPNSQFIHVDYRAPGEPSYRWTDYSGGSGGGHHKAKHKDKARIAKAKRPTS
ncbi:MAG: DUF882 domain-containing protein [Deltaproteobacteria bacterium]|nr:DUF882 domain-containing protein [Deltaproteobacteria bacterium]